MNRNKGFSIPQNGEITVIFDMDGVIVDSGQYHYAAWCTLLKKRGIDYKYQEFKQNFGRRTDMQVRRILGDIPDDEVAAIVKEKDAFFRQIAVGNLVALPGAVNLIKTIKEHHGSLGLGSSSPLPTIELVLTSLGVKEYFDAIVCGPEVQESKPSPQIYLATAKKLNVDPARCIVIEDAVVGIQAAKGGGMKAIAVTNTHAHDAFYEADLIVDSLDELGIGHLAKLLFPGAVPDIKVEKKTKSESKLV